MNRDGGPRVGIYDSIVFSLPQIILLPSPEELTLSMCTMSCFCYGRELSCIPTTEHCRRERNGERNGGDLLLWPLGESCQTATAHYRHEVLAGSMLAPWSSTGFWQSFFRS